MGYYKIKNHFNIKSIFPGINTLEERKKFAIFHFFTIFFSTVVSIFIMFIFNSGYPFKDIYKLLTVSIIIWNFLGSIRFYDDAFDDYGGFIAKGVSFILILFFPFFYFHNLYYLLIKTKATKSKCQEIRSVKKLLETQKIVGNVTNSDFERRSVKKLPET